MSKLPGTFIPGHREMCEKRVFGVPCSCPGIGLQTKEGRASYLRELEAEVIALRAKLKEK